MTSYDVASFIPQSLGGGGGGGGGGGDVDDGGQRSLSLDEMVHTVSPRMLRRLTAIAGDPSGAADIPQAGA